VSGATRGADPYPPEKVTDLSLSYDEESQQMQISFTSPGDDFFEGIGK